MGEEAYKQPAAAAAAAQTGQASLVAHCWVVHLRRLLSAWCRCSAGVPYCCLYACLEGRFGGRQHKEKETTAASMICQQARWLESLLRTPSSSCNAPQTACRINLQDAKAMIAGRQSHGRARAIRNGPSSSHIATRHTAVGVHRLHLRMLPCSRPQCSHPSKLRCPAAAAAAPLQVQLAGLGHVEDLQSCLPPHSVTSGWSYATRKGC